MTQTLFKRFGEYVLPTLGKTLYCSVWSTQPHPRRAIWKMVAWTGVADPLYLRTHSAYTAGAWKVCFRCWDFPRCLWKRAGTGDAIICSDGPGLFASRWADHLRRELPLPAPCGLRSLGWASSLFKSAQS